MDGCQKRGIAISESFWSSALTPSFSTEGRIRMGLEGGLGSSWKTKPFKLVAVAVANKLARIAFAIMRDGSIYGDAMA